MKVMPLVVSSITLVNTGVLFTTTITGKAETEVYDSSREKQQQQNKQKQQLRNEHFIN